MAGAKARKAKDDGGTARRQYTRDLVSKGLHGRRGTEGPVYVGPCRCHKNVGLFSAIRTVDGFENGNDVI